jgi:hypothetical protein
MNFILIRPVVLHYTEYEWSITFKHNTFIPVTQNYMFQFNRQSSGIT